MMISLIYCAPLYPGPNCVLDIARMLVNYAFATYYLLIVLEHL